MKLTRVTMQAVMVLVSVAVVNAGYYADTVLADNPLAYWRLDDAAASGTAASETGSYDGTYYGLTSVPGPSFAGFGTGNTAANFDGGAGHYLAGTTLGNLGSNFTVGFTFEAWINTTDVLTKSLFGVYNAGSMAVHVTTNQTAGGTINNSGSIRTFFRTNDGKDKQFGANASNNPDATFNDGQWHHFVATYNVTAGIIQFYLDGEAMAMTIQSNNVGFNYVNFQNSLAIGADSHYYNGIRSPWLGLMDEVAVYNLTLTADQVALHYAAAFVPEPMTMVLFGLGLGRMAANASDGIVVQGPIAFFKGKTAEATPQAIEAARGLGKTLIGTNEATMANFMAAYDVTLMNPAVLCGMFIGAMMVFVFAAMTMKAVGRAAGSMVEEVRRQFKAFPGIMEGTEKPDYARCVAISTAGAQREMILPSLMAIIVPVVTGLIFGVSGVMGLLVGGLANGFVFAIMLNNAGGAWDNAKKFIEKGNFGGKRSEAHKAGVTCDTIGDPFKDTTGPSLNILIKLMTMVSVVFAGLVVAWGGKLF